MTDSSSVFCQTFRPAAVPLAVRSPYFSAWQNTTIGTNVADEWPQFWNDNENNPNPILGWAGIIQVDNVAYKWLGADTVSKTANLSGIQVTPTRTIYTIQAGPMDVIVTFLTPIEPSDWVRQSIPFSYVAVNASSNDGQPHHVQLYSDISAEWLSSNRSALAQWSTNSTSSLLYHQIELQTSFPFVETQGQAEDGTLYYTMLSANSITYQTGQDAIVRGNFVNNGILPNTKDTDYRAISNDYPVFAIAVNLGSIMTIENPPVWAVGYVRNPSIKYTTSTGDVQLRAPYYVTQYDSIQDVILAFLSDYNDALSRSEALDNQLTSAASGISSEYSDLIALASRQAFGGIDITVSNATGGGWNTSDVMIFMKNIGIDSRVNPVETLYAAFPIFLYLNASYGKPLLAPLLDYQDSSLYTLPYAASDLGTQYPVASGDSSTSTMGIEQSGNMLIMVLAHARASGDGSLIEQHYNLLKSWTNYLVANTKTPNGQESADDQNTANMTNLAIKGIIAIKAMSEISQAFSQANDSQQFASTAAAYANTWQSLAVTSANGQFEHIAFSYGDTSSWALMYNLYADRLLQTGLIAESLYDAQATYYQDLITSNGAGRFGLPIDSTTTQGDSAWMAFAAATVSNTTIRNNMISMAWAHAASNLTPGVFPTMYDVITGDVTESYANPGQGAMFAPLALSVSNKSIVFPPSTVGHVSNKTHVNVGAIAGGVVGGVFALGLILVAILLWRRRTRVVSRRDKDYVIENPEPLAFPYESAPFVPSREAEPRGPTPPVMMSSKLREHLRGQQHQSTPSSSAYSITAPGSSREPPSTLGTGSDVASLSPNEIIGLRTEVENLRRVMQELHADRLEAPPEYEG